MSFCAASYKGAARLAEAVKLLFATYSGTFADGTVVQTVKSLNEFDDMEDVPHGTIYTRRVDFEFGFVDNNGASRLGEGYQVGNYSCGISVATK